MERLRSSPSTLLLALALLLLAPLLQARELGGGSYEQSVRSPLVLPASDDDEDGAVRPKLNALPGMVGRPAGRAPPAPKPGPGKHPMREPPPSRGLSIGSSSPGVSGGRPGLAPPPPKGNPSPHDNRSSGPPAADVPNALRVFRDALVGYVVGA